MARYSKRPSVSYLLRTMVQARRKQACLKAHLAQLGIHAAVVIQRSRVPQVRVTPRTAGDYRQLAGAAHHLERLCRL